MSLTIVSHNAYWFQGSPSLWGEERQEPHPDAWRALIRLYTRLRPDVLCLQEVPSLEAFERLQSELGMEGFYAQGGIRHAYGGAVLVRGLDAHFTDLTATKVNDGRVFERACIQASIRLGEASLDIVGIHLASNRFAPERRGEPVRLAEINALFRSAPEPAVVAGDFNAKPDSAIYAFMRDRAFVDAAMCDGTPPPIPKAKRVDYAWVAGRCGPESIEHLGLPPDDLLIEGAEPPTRVSDHPPVVIRLRVNS